MRISTVGKGGSGKTTLATLIGLYLAQQNDATVVAIDADINQHLGVGLGMTEDQAAAIPPLGLHIEKLKEYVRGDNPRIASTEAVIKTTPPGHGSRLLRVLGDDPFHTLAREINGVHLLAAGAFEEEDLGVSCYHSKLGAVELYLNHLVDREGEYVIADMTAGADAFASGLFSRFDLTLLVVEPTKKSVSVYRQFLEYAATFDINLRVIGNKIQSAEDIQFLRDELGHEPLGVVPQSSFVRALDQGRMPSFTTLDDDTRHTLETIKIEIDKTPKDWARFQTQMNEIHLRNAQSWGNAKVGRDLASQIDPTFVFSSDRPT